MNHLQQHYQDTGNDEPQWVQIAETIGVSQTAWIVDYLRDSGIHAVALESRALGLITGANSSARVMVPEKDVGPALDLLEPENDLSAEENGAEEIDSTSSGSPVGKTLLGATAVAINPLGAGIAYALSKTIGGEEYHSAGNQVDCPECGTGLELSDDEMLERRFICPECNQEIRLDDFAVCPSCRSELELDAEEQTRGWYICPECRRAVRLEYF